MNDASGELRPAQRSLVVFGFYLLGLAVVLLAAPNVLLAMFGIPATEEIWIRVAGMLVGFLGWYDVRHGPRADREFLEMTVKVRLTVPVVFLAFVLFAGAPWQLLLFAGFDLLGAGWTWWSLRRRPAVATAQG